MDEHGTASQDLQARLELRQQLEEATAAEPQQASAGCLDPFDAATVTSSPKADDTATVTSSPKAGALNKTVAVSPRSRPPDAVEREEELKETFRQAAERSSWNPFYQSDESWNGRHQLSYCNEEMSQNCRCYFDRWLDHKELLPPDAVQVQKPTWRLEPDGVSTEQRKVERSSNAVYSVSGPGLRASAQPTDSDTPALSKENVIKRRAMRVSRERPWELPPAPFFLSQRRSVSQSALDSVHMVSASTQTEMYGKELPNWVKEQEWDGQHHVTFSNFQNLQGSILNPAPVRSYFDRPREYKKPMDPKAGVVRILPLWRLEPLPGVDHVELPEEGLWPRNEPLEPRSGRPLQKRAEILGHRPCPNN